MLSSIQNIQKLEKIIFSFNKDNIEQSVQSILNLFDNHFPDTFNLLVSQFLYSTFISHMNDENLCIRCLTNLDAKEKENFKITNKLINIFSQCLLRIKSQESFFMIENLIEKGFFKPSFVKNLSTLYFSHYKTIEKVKNMINLPFYDEFISNIEELSKDDWKLHKKLIKEGINPLEIAKILRNDDLEKLQEISSQTNFDFNQIIEPSIYERYSFINKENVSLIDYCAFFCSIQCFKYLLLNGSNVKNTLKYAIAGGNLEIIHLCEHNDLLFEGVYETAIEFHRNDIFYYFYENKIIEIKNLTPLGILCIKYNNYEIFSFLEKEGMKINDDIINQISKNGNTFLINNFIKKNQIPNDTIVYACISGNIEIVKLLLEQKEIDINVKDI